MAHQTINVFRNSRLDHKQLWIWAYKPFLKFLRTSWNQWTAEPFFALRSAGRGGIYLRNLTFLCLFCCWWFWVKHYPYFVCPPHLISWLGFALQYSRLLLSVPCAARSTKMSSFPLTFHYARKQYTWEWMT